MRSDPFQVSFQRFSASLCRGTRGPERRVAPPRVLVRSRLHALVTGRFLTARQNGTRNNAKGLNNADEVNVFSRGKAKALLQRAREAAAFPTEIPEGWSKSSVDPMELLDVFEAGTTVQIGCTCACI